jgi:TetR/AcrR family transcriptional repressor of nem operon
MARPKQFDPEIAVDQAMEVFWRKGYAATTPQDLVDALGIGKGSLYNAFGSKHSLFEQALRRYRDSQALALVEMIEESGPVKARLRKALRFLGASRQNSRASKRRRRSSSAACSTAPGAFRALIEEGQRAGEIAPERDPAALGSLLLNTLVGMRLMARVAEGPEHRHVVDYGFGGIASAGRSSDLSRPRAEHLIRLRGGVFGGGGQAHVPDHR